MIIADVSKDSVHILVFQVLERERDSTSVGSANSDEMDMETAFRTLLVDPAQRQVIAM